uniref:(northern house mosquito) hypothetical protein n=1 Tax=Culex pipiens TaxID=7175 RepID=A0A8D8B2G3_CULPI
MAHHDPGPPVLQLRSLPRPNGVHDHRRVHPEARPDDHLHHDRRRNGSVRVVRLCRQPSGSVAEECRSVDGHLEHVRHHPGHRESDHYGLPHREQDRRRVAGGVLHCGRNLPGRMFDLLVLGFRRAAAVVD